MDDLDETAGYVAAEANHTQDRRQRKERDQLFDRIGTGLESHIGESNYSTRFKRCRPEPLLTQPYRKLTLYWTCALGTFTRPMIG